MVRKKRSSKKKAYRGIFITAACIAIGVIGLVAYQYNAVKAWSNIIYPGVSISGVDVSGRTKEQAKQILTQKFNDGIIKKKIIITAPDRNYTLDHSKLNMKYNIDDMVNQALIYGKDSNIFTKYRIIKGSEKKQLNLGFTYDQKPVNELINTIEKEVNKDPVDASVKRDGGSFTVIPQENGRKLKKDELKKEVTEKIDGTVGTNATIKAPIETVSAKITSDKLSSINARIGTFSTDFGSISSAERANNIRLATKSINGKVLMPGDSFSFNDIVGERTADRGYMAAPVIIGNQVDSGLGGGICQVSTTLYNAVLRSNIKPTERSHHTLPSHYVPLGMDATVDWGNLDYKFKNTLDYPLFIEASTYGGYVTFNIYSNSSLTNTVSEVKSEVYDTIQPGTKYVDDPTLPVGQTEQTQAPYTGYKVKVVKTTTKNGVLVSEDVISDDFYKPVDAVIKRGTKK